MNRLPVSSRFLASIGYDHAEKMLEIEFRDRAIYQFFDVPDSLYEALLTARSKGEYFYAAIRSVYSYKQAKDASRFIRMVDMLRRFFVREEKRARYRKISL